MNQHLISWLHISDIHFNPSTEWRDSVSRASLIKYLANVFAEGTSLQPDFVFCTGDIAFGEKDCAPLSDQYKLAKEFFDSLLGKV